MFSGQIEFARNKERTRAQQFHHRVDEFLTLRSLIAEDAEELFSLTEANRASLRQWLPWLDDNTTADHTLAYIQRTHANAEANRELVAAICYEGAIAGVVGIHALDWNNRSGSVGYWLGQAYRGKGLMTRACKAILDYGFTDLALHRIEIRCAPRNIRSCAIPERLGFTYEGTLRDAENLYGQFVDHKVYAMLQPEWSGWAD